MVRVDLFFSVLLVVCALGLVGAQDRARRLFGGLERAQTRTAQLEVQWDQLQIEQTALAKASRIDARARRELAMESISPERTLHLKVDPVERVVHLGSQAPAADPAPRAPARRPARAAGAR